MATKQADRCPTPTFFGRTVACQAGFGSLFYPVSAVGAHHCRLNQPCREVVAGAVRTTALCSGEAWKRPDAGCHGLLAHALRFDGNDVLVDVSSITSARLRFLG